MSGMVHAMLFMSNISALQVETVQARDKHFCNQDAAFRSFLHDVTGAVPLCAVAPPSVRLIVLEVILQRNFRNAGAQAQLWVSTDVINLGDSALCILVCPLTYEALPVCDMQLPCMQEHCPILHDFTAHELRCHKNRLPRNAATLMKRVLELAKAGYIPADLQQCKAYKAHTAGQPRPVAAWSTDWHVAYCMSAALAVVCCESCASTLCRS